MRFWLFLLALVFAAGVGTGSWSFGILGEEERRQLLSFLELSLARAARGADWPFWNLPFLVAVKLLLLAWLSSFTRFALPAIASLVFLRGVLWGFSLTLFGTSHGPQGFLLPLAFPGEIGGLLVFAALCALGLAFSGYRRRDGIPLRALGLYSLILLLTLALQVGANALDRAVSPFLLRWLSSLYSLPGLS